MIAPAVDIVFGAGVTNAPGFFLGDPIEGILGQNALGDFIRADISDQVIQIAVRRGRDDIFQSYAPGAATITFWDETGDFNPQNTAGPYFGELTPLRYVRVGTTVDGDRYRLFSGYVESWSWQFQPNLDRALVTIQAADAFRLLNLATVDTIAGAAAGDTTAERAALILDAAGWPAELRDLTTTSTATVQADPGGPRPALEVLQQIEQAEAGALFCDAAGRLQFLSLYDLAVNAVTDVLEFDDSGTKLRFDEYSVRLDDTDLVNVATVTAAGGTPQTVTDAVSVAEYFARNLELSDVIVETDAQAAGLAGRIVRRRATPALEIESVGLNLVNATTAELEAAVDTDFGRGLEITLQAPGGNLFIETAVQSIAHDIEPGRWRVTFGTAPPLATPFILGSAKYGRLGEDTL